MTRKEAAEIIEKEYIEYFEGGASIWEALKMAADALKDENALIDEALKHIDKYTAEVNALKTGKGGEIDFMKKDGILAGLSMARFFVERLKEGEQE